MNNDANESHAEVLLQAAGCSSIAAALKWVADGSPLDPQADIHSVLACVSALPPSEGAGDALTRLARKAAESDLDLSRVLFAVESVPKASEYGSTLAALALKCPGDSLVRVTADAVAAAQRAEPATIEVLCAVAGISVSDLRKRTTRPLPSNVRGRWEPQQVRAAFTVIDGVVRGAEKSPIPGATPARPVELLQTVGTDKGWAAVESMRSGGVPYEVLLVQRDVGTAWGAHRNRTGLLVGKALVDLLCKLLDTKRVKYLRSTQVGGDVKPTELQALVTSGKQLGILTLDANGEPMHGVVFAVATDSGTARASSARLIQMGRPADVPLVVVVAGPGWEERTETGDLAAAFGGRLYSDRSLESLAHYLSVTPARDTHHEGPNER